MTTRLRLIFLAFVLIVTPGYRFRCWWACTDQTAIQHDYIEQRDHCRAYAQLKLDMVMRNNNIEGTPLNRQTQLVNLFSDCMATKGWDIPKGSTDAGAPTADSISEKKAPLSKEEAIAIQQQRKWALTRSSECAFARNAAAYSSISAARAKACDLECEQRLKEAPDAPRPAACPSIGLSPSYSKGVEREYDPENN
ncbi:MAG: hypothetical protein ACK502_07205 [Alphaproteobacteria bacterium]